MTQRHKQLSLNNHQHSFLQHSLSIIIPLILVSSAALAAGSTNPNTSLRNALNVLINKQKPALIDMPALHAYYNSDNNDNDNHNKRKRSINYNERNFHHDDYNIAAPLRQLEYEEYDDDNDNEEHYLTNKYPYLNDDLHMEHTLNDNYNTVNQDNTGGVHQMPDIDNDALKNKKNVNWSQYFGIDRRRKKTGFYGKPDTQANDDDWFVRHYYETLVQNLQKKNREMHNLSLQHFNNKIKNNNNNNNEIKHDNINDNNNNKRTNNLNDMIMMHNDNDNNDNNSNNNNNNNNNNNELSSRLRENFKNFMMKEQPSLTSIKQQYAGGIDNIEDEVELQRVKDIIMNGLAASYSLKKMQEALSDLKNTMRISTKLLSPSSVGAVTTKEERQRR